MTKIHPEIGLFGSFIGLEPVTKGKSVTQIWVHSSSIKRIKTVDTEKKYTVTLTVGEENPEDFTMEGEGHEVYTVLAAVETANQAYYAYPSQYFESEE